MKNLPRKIAGASNRQERNARKVARNTIAHIKNLAMHQGYTSSDDVQDIDDAYVALENKERRHVRTDRGVYSGW